MSTTMLPSAHVVSWFYFCALIFAMNFSSTRGPGSASLRPVSVDTTCKGVRACVPLYSTQTPHDDGKYHITRPKKFQSIFVTIIGSD